MRTIKDSRGDEWRIPALSVGLITDLRVQADFVIGDHAGKTREEAVADASALLLSLFDPFVLGKVLWVLVEPQAQAKGIDGGQFGYLFTAEEFPAIREAIAQALVDFRHPPAAATEIKAMLPGMMHTAENALIAALKNSVTDSAASSASTLAP